MCTTNTHTAYLILLVITGLILCLQIVALALIYRHYRFCKHPRPYLELAKDLAERKPW